MKNFLFSFFLLALLMSASVLADSTAAVASIQPAAAREITAECKLTCYPHDTKNAMLDRRYNTYWGSNDNDRAWIEVQTPDGSAIGGVYLKFYDNPGPFAVQALDSHGEWAIICEYDQDYRSAYLPLPDGYDHIRIIPRTKIRMFYLSEFYVFSSGSIPDWVQTWSAPLDDADLLVISGHPDDELLFFGGLIPYYAGQLKMNVQVAYLVGTTPYRRLELLDGLWHCGVRNYPEIGTFTDKYEMTLSRQYEHPGWSEKRVSQFVAGLYRRYQPEVVVVQDLNGEYGHGAHQAAAHAALQCASLAAQPDYETDFYPTASPWQISKLYIHLYPNHQLHMDWKQPLDAFGGKTGLQIAAEAFAMHRSQQLSRYEVLDGGQYDNALFGLAFTTVGYDMNGDDLFEHIDHSTVLR